jgi:hypothetical protein
VLSTAQDISGKRDYPVAMRVFPTWPDRVLDDEFQDWHIRYGGASRACRTVDLISRMSGELGLGSHSMVIAVTAACGGYDQVAVSVLTTLTNLNAHRQLNTALLAEAVAGRSAAGTLAIAPMSKSWQQIIDAGGLSVLWPVMTAVTAELCANTPRPSGLPGLLRLLRSLAHEVPHPVVPQAVRDLANSRGTSRSQVEARRLVQTFDEAR